MGCGQSIDQSFQKIDTTIWRGKLTVEVKNAAIHEDSQLIGKQDPFVKIRFGRQMFQTEPHDDGGQFPKWNTTFNLTRTDEEDYIHCEIWDANILRDCLIAEGGCSLTKVRKGGNLKLDQECNLYGKGKQMGVLNLSIAFDLEKGCEQHPEVLAPDTTGKLNVWPKGATLQRDLTGLLTSMQPICVVRLGDHEVSSSVDSQNKLNPQWSDQLILNRDEIQRDTVMLEIRNFSESSSENELIGVGFVPFTPALLLKKVVKTVPIYFNGKLAGNVSVEYLYETNNKDAYSKAAGTGAAKPVAQEQKSTSTQQTQPSIPPQKPINNQQPQQQQQQPQQQQQQQQQQFGQQQQPYQQQQQQPFQQQQYPQQQQQQQQQGYGQTQVYVQPQQPQTIIYTQPQPVVYIQPQQQQQQVIYQPMPGQQQQAFQAHNNYNQNQYNNNNGFQQQQQQQQPFNQQNNQNQQQQQHQQQQKQPPKEKDFFEKGVEMIQDVLIMPGHVPR